MTYTDSQYLVLELQQENNCYKHTGSLRTQDLLCSISFPNKVDQLCIRIAFPPYHSFDLPQLLALHLSESIFSILLC